MEYLTLANQAVAVLIRGDDPPEPSAVAPAVSARGRHVVIIGGGDTGADCLGTAHRQWAASGTQLEMASQPWPTYPMVFRASSAHEEGGERAYAVSTTEFLADQTGRVRALRLVEVDMVDGRIVPCPGTDRELPCDLVLFAMGFTGAEEGELLAGLGISLDTRGRVPRDDQYATPAPGVFVAGDMGRGQSLIVWAIAEGRSAAAAADRYLAGETSLPVAIPASAAPLRLTG